MPKGLCIIPYASKWLEKIFTRCLHPVFSKHRATVLFLKNCDNSISLWVITEWLNEFSVMFQFIKTLRTDSPRIYNGEKIVSSMKGAGKNVQPHGKEWTAPPILLPYTKVNSEWIK